MKKIILTTVIAAAAFLLSVEAQAQGFRAQVSFGNNMQDRQSFYYYPSANVYFNVATNQYVYARRNGEWTMGYRLPSRFRIDNCARFMVYHNGMDVWSENRAHIAYYGRGERQDFVARPYYNQGYQQQGYNNCNR